MSDIIAARMLPSAMEIMDALSIEAAEAAVHAHYPKCKGLLLVELDGPCSEVDAQMRAVEESVPQRMAHGRFALAQSEQERALVWKGRKAAFAAVGRISPNYIVQDGVIPRTALPRLLDEIERLATAAGLRVANVFHAGDGNLHPLVLYDQAVAGQEERRWKCPIGSCGFAWITAARSPASTAWARRSRRRWATCSRSRTWPPCNWCAAHSIRRTSPIPTRCFRGPACARRSPAPIRRIRWKRPALRRFSDEGSGRIDAGARRGCSWRQLPARSNVASRWRARRPIGSRPETSQQIAEVLRFAHAQWPGR